MKHILLALALPGILAQASPPVKLKVPGNEQWTDTGVDVRESAAIKLHATGRWCLNQSQDVGMWAGPTGYRGLKDKANPVPDAPLMSLIARIGNGSPISPGPTLLFTARESGRLYLGPNDFSPGDNLGELMVTIEVLRRPARDAVSQAELALSVNPDDPQANVTLGRHYLSLGDADRAVLHLAKGSDAALKAAAEAEEGTDSKKGSQLIPIGDEWVKAATKHPLLRQACLDRASHWYARAWQNLEDSEKPKFREKIRRIWGNPSAPPPSKSPPRGWPEFRGAIDRSFFHSGKSSARLVAEAEPHSISTDRFPCAPGSKIVVTAWVASDGTMGPRDDVFVRYWSRFGKFLGQEGPSIPFDLPCWYKVSAELTAPEDTFQVDVSVQMRSTVGTFWVDDVSLKIEGREMLRNGGLEE